MEEIRYPATIRYFIARDSVGSVLHVGETMPDQVTTTGQPMLAHTDDVRQHLIDLEPYTRHILPLPSRGNSVGKGMRYHRNGRVYMAKISKTRTEEDPEQDENLSSRRQDRSRVSSRDISR